MGTKPFNAYYVALWAVRNSVTCRFHSLQIVKTLFDNCVHTFKWYIKTSTERCGMTGWGNKVDLIWRWDHDAVEFFEEESGTRKSSSRKDWGWDLRSNWRSEVGSLMSWESNVWRDWEELFKSKLMSSKASSPSSGRNNGFSERGRDGVDFPLRSGVDGDVFSVGDGPGKG
jgi:hypothetical protein